MRLFIILLQIFLISNTLLYAYDDEDNNSSIILKGIPQSYDAEYSNESDYKYYSIEKVISLFYDKPDLTQNISTIGYIGRDSSFKLNNGELLLQRLLVICCKAHAKPVSIYLIIDDTNIYQNNDWVKISGQITYLNKEFGKLPAIKVEKIFKIPKPKIPYLNCDDCSDTH